MLYEVITEDARALRVLDATPVWLDFLDDQYGAPAALDDIAKQLAATLDAHPGFDVAAPAGLFHRDHLATNRAALAVLARGPRARRWLFYEDALYRRVDDLMAKRLADWRRQGWIARVAAPLAHARAGRAAKAEAVRAYASQVALFDAHALVDLHVSETYWRLQCETSSA